MGDVADYDRQDRPSTAQPPPEHVPGAASVHDLVAADILAQEYPPARVEPVLALLAERRAFGLSKYGTVLQVEDPKRRAELDLLDELGDALVYAFRAAARGVEGASSVYEALQVLTMQAARRWYPR